MTMDSLGTGRKSNRIRILQLFCLGPALEPGALAAPCSELSQTKPRRGIEFLGRVWNMLL